MGTQWYSGDSGGKWHMWVMCHFSVILTQPRFTEVRAADILFTPSGFARPTPGQMYVDKDDFKGTFARGRVWSKRDGTCITYAQVLEDTRHINGHVLVKLQRTTTHASEATASAHEMHIKPEHLVATSVQKDDYLMDTKPEMSGYDNNDKLLSIEYKDDVRTADGEFVYHLSWGKEFINIPVTYSTLREWAEQLVGGWTFKRHFPGKWGKRTMFGCKENAGDKDIAEQRKGDLNMLFGKRLDAEQGKQLAGFLRQHAISHPIQPAEDDTSRRTDDTNHTITQ